MRLPGFLRPGTSANPSAGNGGSRARKRIRAALAVLAALNGILLFMVFRPPGRSPAERKAELERNQAQHESTSSTIKQMRELQTKLQSAIQNDQQFSRDHFLQRKTAFSAMVADLEKLASQNQLKTSGVTYRLKEDSKQPGFVQVDVMMAVDGQYSDLVRFVNRLEQSQLFWIIDSMSVSSSAGHGLRLSLEMGTLAMPA